MMLPHTRGSGIDGNRRATIGFNPAGAATTSSTGLPTSSSLCISNAFRWLGASTGQPGVPDVLVPWRRPESGVSDPELTTGREKP
jgi:hypothetical protein